MTKHPGDALQALRKKERKPCAVCGKPFTALVRAMYCSERCKQRAKYDKHRQHTPGRVD